MRDRSGTDEEGVIAIEAFPGELVADEVVAVLVEDPDLGEGLPRDALAAARRAALARCYVVAAGPWTPAPDGVNDLGLLILNGLLVRRLRLDDQVSIELLGAGDLLRPADEDVAPLSHRSEWIALSTTRLAVLDLRFAHRIGPWPSIVARLLGRALRRSRWLAFSLAINHRTRVEERLLLLFWQLAQRWGTVGRDGVLVPLPLTHEMLAMLVGARRPTVTTALSALQSEGRVRREGIRGWFLPGRPPGTLNELLSVASLATTALGAL